MSILYNLCSLQMFYNSEVILIPVKLSSRNCIIKQHLQKASKALLFAALLSAELKKIEGSWSSVNNATHKLFPGTRYALMYPV